MKIAIAAPPYHCASGGIRVLHYLGALCRGLGHQVDMKTPVLNPDWGDYSQPLVDPDVTVVPDIHPATTEGRVVRWVLYFPGRLAGPVTYPEHEMVWAFLPEYLPGARLLYLPSCEMFGADDEIEKDLESCFWEGKGNRAGSDPATWGNEILRHWPTPRAELIKLLKRCKRLYTCDPFTAVNEEAAYCGCEVWMWNGAEYVRFDPELDKFRPMNPLADKERVRGFLAEVANHFGVRL